MKYTTPGYTKPSGRDAQAAVELGRTWRVRHGNLRFPRPLLGGCGRAAMLNWGVRARRQAPPQATLWPSSREQQAVILFLFFPGFGFI